tara:strand:+ start:1047 stop:3452 length:2406 start_codon:yes stop_codon:yes gene_type:complete
MITTLNFPSQAVSDAEKLSYEYGLKVGKAIESEWFNNNKRGNKYLNTKNQFHKLRLYARGEQPVQKYKDELSINGDLSYLNLDWKPVPIIPKFVDILVNGIAERMYDVKAVSTDSNGVDKRTKYMESMLRDMRSREFNDYAEQNFNVKTRENPKETLPDTEEELALHMQLSYKQSIEVAEEQALKVLFEGNNYELIRKRFYRDLTVLGIGAVKTCFNTSEGATIDYVDPADLVYSYSKSPYYEDIYYVGEVKYIPLNELVRQFPHLSQEELEDIAKNKSTVNQAHGMHSNQEDMDDNKVQVLYFNYKTYMNEVYKVKETATGADKAILKDDSFNPPENMDGTFARVSRAIEVLYDGAMVLGTKKMLKWELAQNMLRPKSDFTKVSMNYSIVAPRQYNGKIESTVSRITGFADMIQLTHLKLQQVLSRMVPDGIYLDADGLAEIDLGNGTNYNPQEALNMFFQTGSIIGRSMTADGDGNPGRMPIQEISSGSGGQKMGSLIQTYNYYMQMIRDATGLNEARDGSSPDKNALVGVQKIAAANSNTATRHILQAGLFLTSEVAKALVLRVSDILEYSPTANAFIQQIGAHNVGTLKELKDLHLYDFGIHIELTPDEEEKQMLENNIQMALQKGIIELEDAIDIREIKSLKLANQLLKLRRKKKMEKDMEMQQANMEKQSQTNQQAAQAKSQADMQANQQKIQGEIQLEQTKAEMRMQQLQAEMQAKKELMEMEFGFNMQLRELETSAASENEGMKEDRKDERTKIQATQQSEMIDQRNNGKSPKNFESAGNDSIGGDFNLADTM